MQLRRSVDLLLCPGSILADKQNTEGAFQLMLVAFNPIEPVLSSPATCRISLVNNKVILLAIAYRVISNLWSRIMNIFLSTSIVSPPLRLLLLHLASFPHHKVFDGRYIRRIFTKGHSPPFVGKGRFYFPSNGGSTNRFQVKFRSGTSVATEEGESVL